MAAFFSKRAIRQQEQLWSTEVDKICDKLGDACNSGLPINIQLGYLSYATDLVALYTLGHSLGLQESERKAKAWLVTISAVAHCSPLFKQFPSLVQLLLRCPRSIAGYMYPAAMPMLDLHRVSLLTEMHRATKIESWANVCPSKCRKKRTIL
jgi:hypothetical protein